MKILIIGAGMYVTGRDNTGVGTILSSIAESSKNINIEKGDKKYANSRFIGRVVSVSGAYAPYGPSRPTHLNAKNWNLTDSRGVGTSGLFILKVNGDKKLYTRGNGKVGTDISSYIKLISSLKNIILNKA